MVRLGMLITGRTPISWMRRRLVLVLVRLSLCLMSRLKWLGVIILVVVNIRVVSLLCLRVELGDR